MPLDYLKDHDWKRKGNRWSKYGNETQLWVDGNRELGYTWTAYSDFRDPHPGSGRAKSLQDAKDQADAAMYEGLRRLGKWRLQEVSTDMR